MDMFSWWSWTDEHGDDDGDDDEEEEEYEWYYHHDDIIKFSSASRRLEAGSWHKSKQTLSTNHGNNSEANCLY